MGRIPGPRLLLLPKKPITTNPLTKEHTMLFTLSLIVVLSSTLATIGA